MASESSLTRRQVLKVYLTEAAARADTNPLKVQQNTALILNGEQDANYNFFTHEKYYYRIESNEPVVEFYIDWDDGEDNNSKENANFTSIKFDTPQFVGITSHIFTRAKFHYPKIRVKSVEGYWSKYYQASGDDAFYGIDVLQGDSSLPNGRNNKYIIESDETGTDADNRRIPIYAPTVKPPVGVLKLDKKRVYAGIDNDILMGADGIRDGETLSLWASDTAIESACTSVKVRVTYITTGAVESGEDGLLLTNRGDVTVDDLTLAGTPPTISNVTYILKMELLNLLDGKDTRTTTKLKSTDKIALIATNGVNVVGEVSLGNPIVEAEDPRTTVTLDATESFCRSPEQSITSYTIHTGDYLCLNSAATSMKGFTGDVEVPYKAKSVSQVSDVLEVGNRNAHSFTKGIRKASYNFRYTANGTDSDRRWLPAEVLAECQVIADDPHSLVSTDSKSTYTHSFVEHWRNESGTTETGFYDTNYSEDRAAVAGYTWPSDMQSSRLICLNSYWPYQHGWNDLGNVHIMDTDGDLDDHSLNGIGMFEAIDFTKSTSDHSKYRNGINGGTTLDDTANNDNYIIIASDEPFNGIWWESHYDGDGTTLRAPKVIPSVTTNTDGALGKASVRPMLFYSAPEASGANQWKPLKFRNTTVHPEYPDSTWSTRGSWSWVTPPEWINIDPGTIPDHYWPQGKFEGTYESFASTQRLYVPDGVYDSDGDYDYLHRNTNSDNLTGIGVGNFDTLGVATIDVAGDAGATELATMFTADGSKVVLTAHASTTTSTNIDNPTFAIVPGNNNSTATNITTALNANAGFTATRADNIVTLKRVYTITGNVAESTQFFDIDNLWNATNKKYAIMVVINADSNLASTGSEYDTLVISRAQLIDGQQSQLITVIDPMHVSLNNRAITQSISYSHNGKYQIIEDRLGRADIRRIGASGGMITFGGTDAKSDGSTYDRAKFYDYQKKGTPVFLDVTHSDSSVSRFYGVITKMSEDHPTGKMIGKFGLSLQVSHMITLNSSGDITSDGYISLGGEVGNEPKYI
jgi:hypothetical protein